MHSSTLNDISRPVLACVIDDLGTGGAQRIVTVLAGQLVHSVHRLVVISLGSASSEASTLRSYGIEIHTLTADKITSPLRFLRLRRLLRELNPALIHTHLLTANILGSACGWSLGIPVITTLHNVDPHPRFKGTWKRRIETFCLGRLSSRLIAVGPTVAATNQIRLKQRDMEVLPNPLSWSKDSELASVEDDEYLPGVSHRKYVSELISAAEDARFLVTVGRLATEKGWPEFLDIMESLSATHPETVLISIGDGPCEQRIRREIELRQLKSRVYLLGRRDDVAEILAGCDLFILNSRIEGLPMALLESMSVGLPVVATRVGDVEFALGTDVGIVNPGELDSIVIALRNTLDDKHLASLRGAAGRKRVLDVFTPDKWMARLGSIYAEAMN